LFGFGDLLAVKPGEIPKIVQVTSGSNAASRIAKIKSIPEALICLRSGFLIEVHGWRKVKVKRGGKAMRWDPRIEPVTIDMMESSCPSSCLASAASKG